MRLTDLVVGEVWNEMEITGPTDADIRGLTADSRLVEPGYLFAALEGAKQDGRLFIPDALERGAGAVLARSGSWDDQTPISAVRLSHDNPRQAYARIAAQFYAPQPELVAAVTGTNGKSSVAEFARQIWAHAGLQAASLGTLGITAPDRHEIGNLTTPDPADLHLSLKNLAVSGVSHAVIEASSHGLDQHRLDGVELQAAAFTNLSRDHLDYHADMETYFATKRRLFSEILPVGGTAILNADDTRFDDLEDVCRQRSLKTVSYGKNGRDIRLLSVEPSETGQALRLEIAGVAYDIFLPLIGGFQVSNALCALGIAATADIEIDGAVAALGKLEGARGRLELIAQSSDRGGAIYVDYAHTPDALETVLQALRPHASARLKVVFGCGGDRDAGKRAQMGEIAARLADEVIVTDDNPRTEDGVAIRRAILETCPGAREIADREQAIFEAITELGPGDLLVIAGKGHEQGQIVGDQVLPFDDADVARRAAQEGASG